MTQAGDERLPDLLPGGLKLVFCGTAAGRRSAELRSYYADPSNRFWSILAATGLTPRRLRPDEYEQLPQFGIGLTDIAKKVARADSALRVVDFDVPSFRERILRSAPRVVAFNGKKAAAIFLGTRTGAVRIGLQAPQFGEAKLFVVPSTSGQASKYWSERPWRDLADLIGHCGDSRPDRSSESPASLRSIKAGAAALN